MSETTVNDPVAEAVARAKAAAAISATDQMANLPAGPAPGAVAAATPRGVPLSMDTMVTGGLSVDNWIGVKEHGLVAGEKKELVSNDVEVTIDLNAIAVNYAIKFGANPVTYYKTYDRVTEARGGSWDAAVSKAQRVDPSAREYPSVDIPMVLLTPMLGLGKGHPVLIEEGKTIGYSVPTTGWANWKSFWDTCARAGLTTSKVKVKLGVEPKAKGTNRWGLITFTLAG